MENVKFMKKINFFEITIECDDTIMVGYVQTLCDKIQMYGKILNMYDECDNVSIDDISKNTYVEMVKKHGFYQMYQNWQSYARAYNVYYEMKTIIDHLNKIF